MSGHCGYVDKYASYALVVDKDTWCDNNVLDMTYMV